MQDFHESNREAVVRLYESRKAFLCFYAMGFFVSYQEAEDIVQSVFERILSKKVEIANASVFESYAMSAVRNSCLNYISRKKIHSKYVSYIQKNVETEEEGGFVNSRIEAEILWEIFSQVEQLPEGCRQIFKMSYLENLSNQQIADILGISINTVKSQKARSKELLRNALANLFSFAAILFGL